MEERIKLTSYKFGKKSRAIKISSHHLTLTQICTFSIYLIVILISTPVKSEESTPDNVLPSPFLQLCQSSNVTQKFLSLPSSLCWTYFAANEWKFPFFKQKFGRPDLYNFTLVRIAGRPMCKQEQGEFTLKITEIPNPNHPTADVFYSVSPDGRLVYYVGEEHIIFDPHNYCISDLTAGGEIRVNLCKSTCFHFPEEKGDALCLPKCCKFAEAIRQPETANFSVVCDTSLDEDWTDPEIYIEKNSNARDHQNYPQLQFHPSVFDKVARWNCSEKVESKTFDRNGKFRISPDGGLYSTESSKFRLWNPIVVNPRKFDKVCIDGYVDLSENRSSENPNSSSIVQTYRQFSKYIVQFCDLVEEEQRQEALVGRSKVPPVYIPIRFGIFLVAIVIHMFTLSIYIALWSKQNVHGWTVFVFILVQFLLDIVNAVIDGLELFQKGWIVNLKLENEGLCVFFGTFYQFLTIACFSWGTTLVFDAWAKIRSMTAKSRTYKGGKRFAAYSAFGFGLPLLWVLIAITVEYSQEGEGMGKPDFRRDCLISNKLASELYLTLPLSLLVFSNMVFTFFTLKFIWDAKKNVTSLADSKSTSKANNNVKLATKLFVMMGLFLVFHVITLYANLVVFYGPGFVIVDFYWIGQALGLVWVFVLNEKTMQQLLAKYPTVRRVTNRVKKDNMNSSAVGSGATGDMSQTQSTSLPDAGR